MSETVKASEIHLRTVRLWLLTAAAMIFDARGGWRNAADGIRSLDRRMETGHRGVAAVVGKRVADRIYKISDYPPIP